MPVRDQSRLTESFKHSVLRERAKAAESFVDEIIPESTSAPINGLRGVVTELPHSGDFLDDSSGRRRRLSKR
jgi:hypothetical protein